jgi:hypothetical protein
MSTVWILWSCRKTEAKTWIENIFDDKVFAEMHLRLLSDDTDYHHWIQEKEITKPQRTQLKLTPNNS